jgi:hypothetical protein
MPSSLVRVIRFQSEDPPINQLDSRICFQESSRSSTPQKKGPRTPNPRDTLKIPEVERYIIACTESVCGGKDNESSNEPHFSRDLVSASMLSGSLLSGSLLSERHKMTKILMIYGSPLAFYMVVAVCIKESRIYNSSFITYNIKGTTFCPIKMNHHKNNNGEYENIRWS